MTRPRRPLLRWLAALAWAALIFAQSSLSDPPGSGLLDLPHGDKIAHAVSFGVLAGLLTWASGRPLPGATLATLYGAGDELHQRLTPGRSPDPLDLLADGVGAALGALAVAFLTSRARRGPLE